MGKEEAGRNSFQKALSFSKDDKQNSLLVAKCHFNIANIDYGRGEVELTLESFSQALDLFSKSSKPPAPEIYTCLYKMGKLNIDIDRSQALTYFS